MHSPTARCANSSTSFVGAVLSTLATITGLLTATSAAQATYDVSGHWTPSADSSAGNENRYAVHMLLLRGDGNPYSARILWWRAERDGLFHGRQWGWKPEVDDGCQSFPSDTSLWRIDVPLSGMDLFCAGHTSLDQKVFLPGGTDPVTGLYGERQSRLFEVGSGTATGSWSNPGEMSEWRWYPSSVSLRVTPARALVLGGSRHREHYVWGGRRNGVLPSSPVGDSLSRFAPVADDGAWDRSVIPSPFNAGIPTVRERHTSVEMGTGFAAPV